MESKTLTKKINISKDRYSQLLETEFKSIYETINLKSSEDLGRNKFLIEKLLKIQEEKISLFNTSFVGGF